MSDELMVGNSSISGQCPPNRWKEGGIAIPSYWARASVIASRDGLFSESFVKGIVRLTGELTGKSFPPTPINNLGLWYRKPHPSRKEGATERLESSDTDQTDRTHSGENRGTSEVLGFIPLMTHPLNSNMFVPGPVNGAAETISPTPPHSIDFLLLTVPYFLMNKHN